MIQQRLNAHDEHEVDPLAGIAPKYPIGLRWNTQGDAVCQRVVRMKEFVWLKGGEYYYAPSIPYLRNLKYGQ